MLDIQIHVYQIHFCEDWLHEDGTFPMHNIKIILLFTDKNLLFAPWCAYVMHLYWKTIIQLQSEQGL